jgi:hypothetical protein
MRTRLLLCAVTAGLVTACAGDHPVAVPDAPLLAQGAGATLDISGVWDYVEETFMVVKPAGEVLHLRCVSPDGILTINQTGSTFTGTLVHPTGSCETNDGVVIPPPWDLPYEAGIEGRITGRALHIDQQDPVTHCPKNGTIKVSGGIAVELTTVGRCDLSFTPFRPATATNSATATRP